MVGANFRFGTPAVAVAFHIELIDACARAVPMRLSIKDAKEFRSLAISAGL